MRIGLSLFARVALVALLTARCAAQALPALDIEEGAVGSPPSDWFVPTEGWKAELTEEKADTGTRSVKLWLPGESKAPFGNLMRQIPGDPVAGRHVTLTARLLVQGDGQAQMWLRADRPTGMGAFDNMGDRPIRAGNWTTATINADIEPDTETLNIGFMSIGGATMFIDSVALAVSGSKVVMQEPSPPRELTGRGLENVTAAARLLSYVRFFHPSSQAVGVASWDHVAVDVLDHAEPAVDPADLAKRLAESFSPLAPTLQLWPGTPDDAPPPPDVPPGVTKAAVWKHYGAGTVAKKRPGQIYRSSVDTVALDSLPGGLESPFVVKTLGAGVSCRLPVAVFADSNGTLPQGSTPDAWKDKSKFPALTASNRSTRLAGVAVGWGIWQHFYPYFDIVKTDWDAALPAALAKAATDPDERAYLDTLRELVGKLHDGHGSVFNAGVRATSMLPLALEWAGDDLVVVGKHATSPASIDIGDVVLSIDGMPVPQCYAQVRKQISAATDGWARTVSIRMLTVTMPTRNPAELTLRKLDGQTFSVLLPRVQEMTENTATMKRPANGSEIAPGLVYFDLNDADTAALAKALPALQAAKGIVFDMRGYPGDGAYELMCHLIDGPATSARWCVPVVTKPDHEGFEWSESGRWPLMPKQPRLTAPIAFLTDGRAISYAESIMGIVENYKMGEIVGATTAGTNGNVNPISLPGGYEVSWTGMKVLKHDGSTHHGVGIAPTAPATPTARGIAEGRDEVLAKGIEVLKAKIAAGHK